MRRGIGRPSHLEVGVATHARAVVWPTTRRDVIDIALETPRAELSLAEEDGSLAHRGFRRRNVDLGLEKLDRRDHPGAISITGTVYGCPDFGHVPSPRLP